MTMCDGYTICSSDNDSLVSVEWIDIVNWLSLAITFNAPHEPQRLQIGRYRFQRHARVGAVAHAARVVANGRVVRPVAATARIIA